VVSHTGLITRVVSDKQNMGFVLWAKILMLSGLQSWFWFEGSNLGLKYLSVYYYAIVLENKYLLKQ